MKRHASMNRIYRLVWSHVYKVWVPAAEIASGRGKGSNRKLLMAPLLLFAAAGHAEPTGGQIVSGSGSISQSGDTTTINQTSQTMSANWQSFNIAPTETVNFQQPNAAAIAVNRIADTNGTQILGHLNANGQVYLINPNGILFGQGAQVNVGGLVASTLDVNDASLTGASRTFSGSGTGSVVNQGRITAADGGSVALLGNSVSNQGVITAQLGTVALGAGNAVTLTFNGNNLVKMQIDQSVLNSLAENKQVIQADGGQVIMSAGAQNALLASVVNNEGVIVARGIENHDGTIVLLGGMAAGTVKVGGTLDASASLPSPAGRGAGGEGLNGGFIETSAAHVKVADDAKITTLASPGGKSGTWLIDPVDFTIAASGGDMTGAALSASLNGGNVTIQSTSGASGTAGDVNVNDVVSWSANTLTLNAQNNININNTMNGSGTAQLALEYGQGAVAAGNTSTYNVNAPVNLAADNNFSTKLGYDGTVKNYTVITDLGTEGSGTSADLQGMNGNPAGNYVLGGNIDASATSGWNGGAGFMPVGSDPINNPFTGAFDGLGHTINNLTINRSSTDYVGLFGTTVTGSSVRNVGLVGGSISGKDNVGGLVGRNSGTVGNSYAGASINGANTVGGLVGNNIGTVGNSYAGGSVNGTSTDGGLVGDNSGTVGNSYASSSVSGTQVVGGLVGSNSGTVSNSFWDTQTTGQSASAGGTGMPTADMQRQANFTSATAANGNANPNWDFTSTWVIYDGLTAPLLRAFMTPLTVTANGGSKVYDGVAGNGVTYSVTPNSNLLGTLNYGISKNVGSYTTALSGLYSNQQGYIISYANAALTITPRPLDITGVTAGNKVHDGSTVAPLGGTATVRALGGDEVGVGGDGTGAFADADAGTGKAVTVSGFTLSGPDAGNYTAVQPAGLTADIVASNAPDKAPDSALSLIATMTSTPPPSAEDSEAEIKPDDKKESKEDSKPDSKPDSKKDFTGDTKGGEVAEDKPDPSKADTRAEMKPEAKPGSKKDSKADTKTEAKPEAKPNAKKDYGYGKDNGAETK
jgi:filamentous hemagglutinin family protein